MKRVKHQWIDDAFGRIQIKDKKLHLASHFAIFLIEKLAIFNFRPKQIAVWWSNMDLSQGPICALRQQVWYTSLWEWPLRIQGTWLCRMGPWRSYGSGKLVSLAPRSEPVKSPVGVESMDQDWPVQAREKVINQTSQENTSFDGFTLTAQTSLSCLVTAFSWGGTSCLSPLSFPRSFSWPSF